MAPVPSLLRLGVDLLAVVATATLAGLLWRRRSEPTARPLFGVAVLLLAGSVAHVAVADVQSIRRALLAVAADPEAPLWALAGIASTALAMGLWFAFVVQYAGLRGRLIRVAVAVAAAIPTLVLGVVTLRLLLGDGLPPVVGASLGVLSLLLSSLVIVGAFLLLSEGTKPNGFPLGLSVLLSGGALAVALVPIVLSTFLVRTTVPAAYLLASGLFGVAIRRYPTFETLPLARVAGRDRVIEDMVDAVVVVDPETTVRDLNAAAERVFDVDRSSVIGRSLATLLPESVDPDGLVSAGDPLPVQIGSGTTLSVTANRVTDPYEHLVGYLLVCQDVTDRLNRQRRLSVLDQLLIGTVRERMSEVADDAASLFDPDVAGPHSRGDAVDTSADRGTPADTPTDGDDPIDPAAVGDRIWTTTTELAKLVTYAREIERALSSGTPSTGEISDDVRDAIGGVGDRSTPGDAVEVTTVMPDDPVPARIDTRILRIVLELLVAESRERATDAIEIALDDRGERLAIHVVDDRPGGAGDGSTGEFAVRMAELAIEHYGGDVSVAPRDEGGRRIVVAVPRSRETSDPRPVDAGRETDERFRRPGNGSGGP